MTHIHIILIRFFASEGRNGHKQFKCLLHLTAQLREWTGGMCCDFPYQTKAVLHDETEKKEKSAWNYIDRNCFTVLGEGINVKKLQMVAYVSLEMYVWIIVNSFNIGRVLLPFCKKMGQSNNQQNWIQVQLILLIYRNGQLRKMTFSALILIWIPMFCHL